MFIKGYIEFNDKLLSSWVTKWAEIGCGWCWATKRAETGSGLCWTKWAKICKGLGQVVHVNVSWKLRNHCRIQGHELWILNHRYDFENENKRWK